MPRPYIPPQYYSLSFDLLEEKLDAVGEAYVNEYRAHRCMNSLYELQNQRILQMSIQITTKNPILRYIAAMRQAIKTHDWDELLHVLVAFPFKSVHFTNDDLRNIFIKAYFLLLINHPYAKSHSLLLDFFHMGLSCRDDGDKKSLMKVLFSFLNKVELRSRRNYHFSDYNKYLNKKKKQLQKKYDEILSKKDFLKTAPDEETISEEESDNDDSSSC